MPRRKTPNNLVNLTIGISPVLAGALQRMAEQDMRSVPNLCRKILADHLRSRGHLSEDEQRAVSLENVCVLRQPKGGRQ